MSRFCTAGHMLDHYFKIVAKRLLALVAKAVWSFYVEQVKSSLYYELCLQLLKDESLAQLLEESEGIAATRNETLEQIKVL